MATYTSNYGWTKPSGSDNVDISVLNNNLDGQDGVIHDAFLNMAPPFSESSTYAVDDIVLYTTRLYKCHTAVVTPGSWTGSTNWQVYKLSEGGGGSSLTAGDYIDITAGVISVTKEKGEYSLERYVLQSTGGGAPKLVVKKYIDSELISTNEYANNTAHVNIDDTLEIWYSYNPYNWHYKLLVDGVDHSAGYEYEFSYEDTTEYPVDFHIAAGDSTDLVTKSDLTADNVMLSDGVTSVESGLTDYAKVIVVNLGSETSFTAGFVDIIFSIPSVAGYKPIGVIGYNLGNRILASKVLISGTELRSNGVHLYGSATETVSIPANASTNILYIRA